MTEATAGMPVAGFPSVSYESTRTRPRTPLAFFFGPSPTTEPSPSPSAEPSPSPRRPVSVGGAVADPLAQSLGFAAALTRCVGGAGRRPRRRSSPALGIPEPARVFVGFLDGVGGRRLLRGPLLDVEAVRVGDLQGSSGDLVAAGVGVDLPALGILESARPRRSRCPRGCPCRRRGNGSRDRQRLMPS